ncbi:MAG: hypothetical protein AAGD14_03100 [Planctomycetota bacterium]
MEWFDERTAGLIGGILGAVFGAGFGGIGGGVGGPLAAQGKAKGFVLGIFLTAIVCGVALLITAVVAVFDGQPYHVIMPFALVGFVTTVVMGALYPVVRKQYERAENRRLDAESLRRA